MSYAPTEEFIGHGHSLAHSADDSAYTSLFGTFDLSLPEGVTGEADNTNDSTPDNHTSSKPALIDPGSVTGSYHYGKTQFAALEVIRLARTVKYWKVTLPDGSIGKFQGFLTKNSKPSAGQGDTIVSEIEIRATTKLAFTAAT